MQPLLGNEEHVGLPPAWQWKTDLKLRPEYNTQIPLFHVGFHEPAQPTLKLIVLSTDWRHDKNLALHPFGFKLLSRCPSDILIFGHAQSADVRLKRNRWS